MVVGSIFKGIYLLRFASGLYYQNNKYLGVSKH